MFFFITGTAVIFVASVLVIFIIYAIMIVRDIRRVSGILRKEAELVSGDLSVLREKIKTEGWGWLKIFSFLGKRFGAKSKRKVAETKS